MSSTKSSHLPSPKCLVSVGGHSGIWTLLGVLNLGSDHTYPLPYLESGVWDARIDGKGK